MATPTRFPASWNMRPYYGGATWEGYGWAKRGPTGRLSLSSVTAARLTFRSGGPSGELGLELCLGRGLSIDGDMVRTQRGLLPLAAGSYHFELSVYFSDTCTWDPWVRGRFEVIQHVPKGDHCELH